jgi:hypothetical protein
MAMKIGEFSPRFGTGTQQVTGLGFQPKAIIFWTSWNNLADGYIATEFFSFGFSDGVTSVARAGMKESGTFGNGQYYQSEAAAIICVTTSLLALATVQSFDSGGFTLNWTTNGLTPDPPAHVISYLAIAGNGVEAKVAAFTRSTTANQSIDQDITTVGFEPSLVFWQMVGPGPGNHGDFDAVGNGRPSTFGWSCADLTQAYFASETNDSSSGSTSQADSNGFGQWIDTNNSPNDHGSLLTMLSSGFRVRWQEIAGLGVSAGRVLYLALKGVRGKSGEADQPTSNGTQTITGVPFEPELVMLGGAGLVNGVDNDHVQWALGVGDGVTEFCQGGDQAQFGNAQRMHTNAKALRYFNANSTLRSECDVQALTADGFTLNWTTTDATVRDFFWLALRVESVPEVDFGTLPQQSGEVIGLSWVELDHVDTGGNPKTYLWAPVDLNDPIDYYGGYKEPRIIGFGEINRGLSDRLGQYEAAEWSWLASDAAIGATPSHLIRALLESDRSKTIENRMALIRMIDDASRRLLKMPRVLVRGIVRDVQPRAPLHVQFIARDFLASKFGPANLEKQIPQRTISRVQFPDCPIATVKKPVPILYGDLSDAGSSNPPPVLTGTATGAHVDDGYQIFGFAPLVSDAAVPTGLGLTTAGGGTVSDDVPDAKYGVFVTAVDASGRETDPDCGFTNVPHNGSRGTFPANVQTITVNGSQSIVATWSAAANAAKYRVYLSWYYYGARVTQFIEVTAPTVTATFTTSPPWQTPVTAANITPGANLSQWGQYHHYAVSAVYANGETALSAPDGTATWQGHRRPFRVEWLAPAIAPLSYKVYRREPAATWDRVWQVPVGTTQFDDDNLDTNVTYITGAPVPTGAIPLIPVGTVMDLSSPSQQWYRFLVAGHAVKEIVDLYQGGVRVDPGKYGVTFAVPGKTGYSTYFANTGNPQYVDIGGERFTCVMVRGPDGLVAADGSQPLTANVKGKETTGDGTGTLIEQLADIYRDLVVQWFLQNYKTGGPLAVPTWPVDVDGTVMPQVDVASFDALKAVHAVRLVGGYPGVIAFGVNGEHITLRQAIARLNLSADCQSGFNRNSAYFVSALDTSSAVGAAAKNYTQLHDTIRASFELAPRTDEVENIIVHSYRRRYVVGQGQAAWDVLEAELADATAIADRREEKRSPVIELYGVRSASVANDIVRRRLDFYKETPRYVMVATNLKGLSTELGDVIKVTNIEGTGVSGWTDRLCRVVRHMTNPQTYTVRLECLDVHRLFFPSTPTSPTAGAQQEAEQLAAEQVWAAAVRASRWRAAVTATDDDEIQTAWMV